jgi:Bifunctional DNA primase/polymerase, N-terminal
MSHEFLEAALRYAAQGFSIFPCRHATKQPATKRGFYKATTNPGTIRRWMKRLQHSDKSRSST